MHFPIYQKKKNFKSLIQVIQVLETLLVKLIRTHRLKKNDGKSIEFMLVIQGVLI